MEDFPPPYHARALAPRPRVSFTAPRSSKAAVLICGQPLVAPDRVEEPQRACLPACLPEWCLLSFTLLGVQLEFPRSREEKGEEGQQPRQQFETPHGSFTVPSRETCALSSAAAVLFFARSNAPLAARVARRRGRPRSERLIHFPGALLPCPLLHSSLLRAVLTSRSGSLSLRWRKLPAACWMRAACRLEKHSHLPFQRCFLPPAPHKKERVPASLALGGHPGTPDIKASARPLEAGTSPVIGGVSRYLLCSGRCIARSPARPPVGGFSRVSNGDGGGGVSEGG